MSNVRKTYDVSMLLHRTADFMVMQGLNAVKVEPGIWYTFSTNVMFNGEDFKVDGIKLIPNKPGTLWPKHKWWRRP